MRYLLGYDLGSSSVKATLLDIATGKAVQSATTPAQEMPIKAKQNGWAEQSPEMWWQELTNATAMLKAKTDFEANEVAAIGISYQMHGLVVVDKDLNPLHDALIWCDSRAVEIGNEAYKTLGNAYCDTHLLNSPANFTAAKLGWLQKNTPSVFEQIDKFMLPGDYIAARMTGEVCTTISGLSEGIFWDFKNQELAIPLKKYFKFSDSLFSRIVPTFGFQGALSAKSAHILGLKKGTPITYRAGDQPNNAFSLNVLNNGEVAATAGTSGVVYGISENAKSDKKGRVNTFVHVNSQTNAPKNGVLLCLNGTGALNAWLRRTVGNGSSYDTMNQMAAQTPIGAEGLCFLPFGNGAERILENKNINASLYGLNFNQHTNAHLFRAAQESIVFALNYGIQIMSEMGVEAHTVRAGFANMFLSPLFRTAFANTTGATIDLYDTDGAQGAARGAGLGAGIYKNFAEAFQGLNRVETIEPDKNLAAAYQDAYAHWLSILENTPPSV